MFNTLIFLAFLCREQPPPRGCVLKQSIPLYHHYQLKAAASARLCVETTNFTPSCTIAWQPPPRGCVLKQSLKTENQSQIDAAASARLCVETQSSSLFPKTKSAAASARLCVETIYDEIGYWGITGSRLRAAVC